MIQVEEPNYFECTACGFHATMGLMLVAHQAQCENLEPEKREYRLGVLKLQLGEGSSYAMELAKTQHEKQKAGIY